MVEEKVEYVDKR